MIQISVFVLQKSAVSVGLLNNYTWSFVARKPSVQLYVFPACPALSMTNTALQLIFFTILPTA
jgi:hypothetical protein